ncbi:MAG TPA: hypothetical protein VF773_17555 [Verrucomicrobiae bacterium]
MIGLRTHAKRAFQREVQGIRERGYPASPKEVHAWYAVVPPEENAALGILKANEFYVEPGTNEQRSLSDRLVLGEPLPPKLAGAIASMVERNGEALAEVNKAVQLPNSRYPIDLRDGFATLLPHLTHVKRMAELLKWEAIYHSARSNRTNALRGVESGFLLAASLKDEPVEVSALMRISCLRMALSALERVVTEQRLTESEIDRFLVLARAADEHSILALKRGLLGQRGATLPIFNMSHRELRASLGIPPSRAVNLQEIAESIRTDTRGLLRGHRRDPFFYLARMREVETALEMDVAEMVREAERIDGGEERGLLLCFSESEFIASSLPEFSNAMTKTALLMAQIRCVSLALEVEKLRLRNNGEIPKPEELPKQIAEIPKDPVDNELITFELLDSGYQVGARAATALKKSRSGSTNFVPIAFRVLR